MPIYEVRGVRDGEKYTARVEARDEAHARQRAEKAGLAVEHVRVEPPRASRIAPQPGRVSVPPRIDSPIVTPDPREIEAIVSAPPEPSAISRITSRAGAGIAGAASAVGRRLRRGAAANHSYPRGPTCHVCNTGTMIRRRRPAFGIVVHVLGYLIIAIGLVPVVIGLVPAIGLGLASIGLAATEAEEPATEYAARVMQEAEVPGDIRALVLHGETVSREQRSAMTREQHRAVMDAESRLSVTAGGVAAAATGMGILGGTAGVCVGVVPLVLGFILIRKKSMLVCSSCRAALPAG